MLKRTIKTTLIILAMVSWILLFLQNRYLVAALSGSFHTSAYDVTHRLTSPDGKKTALLIKQYNFDLNFRLFIVDFPFQSPSNDFRDALWSSHDYNPDPGANLHEDLEWSNDSSIIAVIIDGEYAFACDFSSGEKSEDKVTIEQLLASRNNP